MDFDHFEIVAPDPVFLRIGNFTIQWYAIFILTGVILALLFAIWEGKKKKISSDLLIELVVWGGLPVSILGARLYFVLFNLESYWQQPARIITEFGRGLAIHGGIIAALLFSWWYLKRKKVPLLPVLDLVAMGFFIGQILGRFGNFMNQEAHGPVINAVNLDAQREFLTALFIPEFIVNGMFINGNYHHPTFLYEALWNFVGLLIAAFILRRLPKILVGEIAAFYAIWYSFGRIFIESLRTDSLMLGPFRVAQVISIATIVAVVILVMYRRKNKKMLIPYGLFDLEAFSREQLRGKKKAQSKSKQTNSKQKKN